MLIAAAVGLALAFMPKTENREALLKIIQGVQELAFTLIRAILYVLPIGIVAFAGQLSAQIEAGVIVGALGKYTAVVMLGNAIQFFIVLPIILTAVVLVGMFMLMNARAGSGGANAKMMNFGKSRAVMVQNDTRVMFKDVAGLQEEKEELEEIVDFLKNPQKYTGVGARIPKGVILVGPPGTGKTLLAKAVAGEAGVPFFSISGSDFVEMFVGVGASRVRDLFEEAKKNAPCIVFIDEIDAVARQRGTGMGGGHDEREQTLTSSWLRWMVSASMRASSSWRRRTAWIFSTRRFCGRADLTERWQSDDRTSRDARRFSAFIRRKNRWARMWIYTASRRQPLDLPEPIWKI